MRALRVWMVAMMLVAGCATVGGVPAGADGSAADARELALRFAQCMRDKGVDLPDPGPDPGGGAVRLADDIDPEVLAAAQAACQAEIPGLAGQGGGPPDAEQLERARRYAQCMREHGLPDFPDPAADGSPDIVLGIDPNDPAFRAAEQACRADGAQLGVEGPR